jgi:hypothetical protein
MPKIPGSREIFPAARRAFDSGTAVPPLFLGNVECRSARRLHRQVSEEDAMKGLCRVLGLLACGVVFTAGAAAAQSPETTSQDARGETGAIEFSPVSPFIHIYAVQYARRLGAKDELLLGLAYANIKYDRGRSHAPTGIVGYRRYLWKKAHLEYQLWTSYNWYYENVERRYYEGAELWNEFRPGYTFDFRVGGTPVFVNVQYLIGFGLYGDESKPQSWKDQRDREGELFMAPMVFMGWRF